MIESTLSKLWHKLRARGRSKSVATLPHGSSLYHDIRRLLPGYQADVIFDVGANEGQSTVHHFVRWFPQARIYCFEPVSATYDILCKKVSSLPNVKCVQVALSNACGRGQMRLAGPSDQFSLHNPITTGDPRALPVELVSISTLDSFCAQQGIPRMGLLKIDTEGRDLDVLVGATGMIQSQCIDLIQVEAGMNPTNTLHVPIERFVEHLLAFGYHMFGIYNQFHEKPSRRPLLRRCDPVFISPRLVAMYSRKI